MDTGLASLKRLVEHICSDVAADSKLKHELQEVHNAASQYRAQLHMLAIKEAQGLVLNSEEQLVYDTALANFRSAIETMYANSSRDHKETLFRLLAIYICNS